MTSSLDAPFYDLISDLGEARIETLKIIEENGGQIIGTSRIADKRNTSKQAASQLLDKMRVESENHEGEGLVTIEKFQSGNRITLTSVGRKVAENTPYGEGSLDTSLDSNLSELNFNRLHGITIDVGVKNSDRVPSEWWGKLQSFEDVDVLENQENDYIVARDKWVFRCHKNSVTMQLRQGCTFESNSSADSFSEFHQSLTRAVDWLSNAVGVPFRVEHCDIKRAECAFEEDHQALLADAVPGLSLQDITVHDKDIGQDVIEFDKSKAVPERETLSGVRSEEVARNLERENRQLALNSQAIEFRHGFESEASIQELNPVQAVQSIKQVESNQESIEYVRSRQDKLLSLKSEERERVDAIEKLVRSNQELLERVVQRLEETEESSSFDDPVQKIFMETWQSEEYSRPWFDHGHLKAWKTEDSGKTVCETILDKETVKRLQN